MDLIPGAHWYASHHADPRAVALYLRHYSAKRYADGRPRRQFCSPGEKLVLLTPNADALFVWHKAQDGMRLDGLDGVHCALFRNESAHRSSELILEAIDQYLAGPPDLLAERRILALLRAAEHEVAVPFVGERCEWCSEPGPLTEYPSPDGAGSSWVCGTCFRGAYRHER